LNKNVETVFKITCDLIVSKWNITFQSFELE